MWKNFKGIFANFQESNEKDKLRIADKDPNCFTYWCYKCRLWFYAVHIRYDTGGRYIYMLRVNEGKLLAISSGTNTRPCQAKERDSSAQLIFTNQQNNLTWSTADTPTGPKTVVFR